MPGAVRHQHHEKRTNNALPYAKPAPKKSWGIGSLFSGLFGSRQREDVQVHMQLPSNNNGPSASSESEGDDESGYSPSSNPTPAQSLSIRGHQMANNLNGASSNAFPATGAPPPPSTPQNNTNQSLGNTPESARSVRNREKIARFLASKTGQELNEVEVAGILSLLNDNDPDVADDEPFRFSNSPSRQGSPSIFPQPTSLPAFPIASSSSTVPFPASSPSPSPGKKLAKNPNGQYRWRGAGTSRPTNRYASPAFGPSRNHSPLRLATPAPSSPEPAAKRRRVGEHAQSPMPPPTMSASEFAPALGQTPSTPGPTQQARETPQRSGAPSPPNGSFDFSFPVSNSRETPSPPSRTTSTTNNNNNRPRIFQTPVPARTAPARPSPLRQAWGNSPDTSFSSASTGSPPGSASATRTASFLEGLVQAATPPPAPRAPEQVVNPYQRDSPVKSQRPRKEKKGKEKEKKEKEKEKERKIDEAAVIAATSPVVRKRTPGPEDRVAAEASTSTALPVRKSPSPAPPRKVNGLNGRTPARPSFMTSSASASSSASSSAPVISLIDDDEPQDVQTGKKRSRRANVEDANEDKPAKATPPAKPVPVVQPSEVIEPEDAPDKTISSTPTPPQPALQTRASMTFSTAPKEPSKLRYSMQLDTPSSPPAQPAQPAAPSTGVTFKPPTSMPAFGPSPTAPISARSTAYSLSPLPSVASSETPPPAPRPAAATLPGSVAAAPSTSTPPDVQAQARTTPASALPVFSFPSAPLTTAQVHPVERTNARVADLAEFDSVAMLLGTVSIPSSVLDPTSSAPAPSGGFNWEAAGLAKPQNKGEWTCGTCGLSNSASLVQCSVCETPR